MEPAGYSCSQKGTNFRLAARSTGSASGTEINTTSLPRACSLRASVVIGFRCPESGRLKKPIFIVDPSLHLTVSPHGRSGLVVPYAHQDDGHASYNKEEVAFIPEVHWKIC